MFFFKSFVRQGSKLRPHEKVNYPLASHTRRGPHVLSLMPVGAVGGGPLGLVLDMLAFGEEIVVVLIPVHGPRSRGIVSLLVGPC